jgi:AraC family transcriptional regulator
MRPDLWLAERRVERAMLMLKSSKASIGEIAVSSGFYDRRHLARVFRNMIGVSPEEWRHLVWN